MLKKWTIAGFALTLAACGLFKKSARDGKPSIIPEIIDPDLDKKGADRDFSPVDDNGNLQLTANLRLATSCQDAADSLRKLMLLRLRNNFNAQLRGFTDGPVPIMGRPDVVSAAKSNEAASDAPNNYTTTNQQVADVEEGDFVKNTGTHMFVARHDRVFVVKSWPAHDLAPVAELLVGDRIQEMLLVGDTTLVIAGQPRLEPNTQESGKSDTGTLSGESARAILPYQPMYSQHSTVLSVVNVSNPASPKMVSRRHVRGSFQSFRRIGQSVRVVLSSYLSYPSGVVEWYSPESPAVELSKGEFAARLQARYDENKRILNSLSLADLLASDQARSMGIGPGASETAASPGYVGIGAPEADPSVANASCTGVHLPSDPVQDLSLTRIVTLDLAKATASSELVLAGAHIVYASRDALYLAGSVWNGWAQGPEAPKPGTPLQWTNIHKFDLTQPGSTPYQASGSVSGALLNQFSMDEYSSVLRVAATEDRQPAVVSGPSSTVASFPSDQTVSHVSALRQVGNKLKVIGRTPDLAPGERIFSSRFADTRGFVVTFRQVDPLFAIDLSKPEEPKVLGSLKIPGFSTYMQFIDRDTLLTIGSEADANTGRVTGLKLSLFDVSNMTQPKETHKHVLAVPGWASSAASDDHKAFTYNARTGHLAIPVSHYSWASGDGVTSSPSAPQFVNRLALFSVGKDTGIDPAGHLDLADLSPELSSQNMGWIPQHLEVRRSVFADNFVYAISAAGIKVAPINNLGNPAAQVVLPCEGCDEVWPMWCVGDVR